MTQEALNAAKEIVEKNRNAVDETVIDQDIVVDNTPAVDDVVESQKYGAEPPVEEPVEKKPRRKPVKGVMKKGRELHAAGHSDEEVLAAIVDMYLEAGRDEKNAKASAAVILYDIKKK
jgi:hypothetical protein